MDITEYIKSSDDLAQMPFMTVYMTIVQLIKDGYIKYDGEKMEKHDAKI